MPLSRDEIEKALKAWNLAWDKHDLEGVMALFHEDVVFENWTGGKVRGKEALRKAWEPWFSDHGNFRFVEEETFIDEKEQKVLYRWVLEWPSFESGSEGELFDVSYDIELEYDCLIDLIIVDDKDIKGKIGRAPISCVSFGPSTALHPPAHIHKYALANAPFTRTKIRRRPAHLFFAGTLTLPPP